MIILVQIDRWIDTRALDFGLCSLHSFRSGLLRLVMILRIVFTSSYCYCDVVVM